MNRKNVIIGLFNDRVDVLSMSGDSVIASRRLKLCLGSELDAWRKDVAKAGERLRTVIQDLKLQGASAVVLYQSPSACSDFSSVSLRNATEARDAAILASAESLTCTPDQVCCAASVVGRDASGNNPQTHVVCAADHERSITCIASLLEQADLSFECAVPIDAAIMCRQVAEGLTRNTPNRACLYVGEHRSFFVISSDRALIFARSIGLGVSTLIHSLMRPIRLSASATPIELNFEVAQRMLHEFGFPQRDQVVEPGHALTGAQIIPLLQPALQRFIVELRQSLRFGVQEDQRQHIELTVTGPGCTIPNFASLISGELRLAVTTDHRYADFDHADPASPHGELMEAITDRKAILKLGLQPRRLAQARQVHRLQRWLWAGAAAALALVAMDAMQYHSKVAQLQARVDVAKSQADDVLALHSTGERMQALISEMEILENSIAAEAGTGINIRACLQELSRSLPQAVRLSNVYFVQDKGVTIGRFTGFAFDTSSLAGRTQLEPLVEKLKESPLFEQVALANVQTSQRGGATGQQFEVTLHAVPAPRRGILPDIAFATGGQTP